MPKKLNSALCNVSRVQSTSTFKAIAYMTGIVHDLQQQLVVLVRGGRVKDLASYDLHDPVLKQN